MVSDTSGPSDTTHYPIEAKHACMVITFWLVWDDDIQSYWTEMEFIFLWPLLLIEMDR